MFKKRPIAIAIAIGGLTAPSAYGQIEEVIVTATKFLPTLREFEWYENTNC